MTNSTNSTNSIDLDEMINSASLEDALAEAEYEAQCWKEIEEDENTLEGRVRMWQNMSPSEMRLRCGEMTGQEIRTVKAVLNTILPKDKS